MNLERCPACGSASKGAYPGKLCDDAWHDLPRPGDVPMRSIETVCVSEQLPPVPSEG